MCLFPPGRCAYGTPIPNAMGDPCRLNTQIIPWGGKFSFILNFAISSSSCIAFDHQVKARLTGADSCYSCCWALVTLETEGKQT